MFSLPVISLHPLCRDRAVWSLSALCGSPLLQSLFLLKPCKIVMLTHCCSFGAFCRASRTDVFSSADQQFLIGHFHVSKDTLIYTLKAFSGCEFWQSLDYPTIGPWAPMVITMKKQCNNVAPLRAFKSLCTTRIVQGNKIYQTLATQTVHGSIHSGF